ncbi:unnamed protein product [Ixodes pacificus]
MLRARCVNKDSANDPALALSLCDHLWLGDDEAVASSPEFPPGQTKEMSDFVRAVVQAPVPAAVLERGSLYFIFVFTVVRP